MAVRRIQLCLAALLMLAAMVPRARADVRWRSGAVSRPAPMQAAELAQVAAELVRDHGSSRIVVHFEGPVQPRQRAALESNGVRLLSYLGDHAYFATLSDDADPAGFAGVPGTLSIETVEPANKLHPDLARGTAHPWTVVAHPDQARAAPVVAVHVLFHRDFDLDRAEELLARHGGSARSKLDSINGVVAHLAMDRLSDLASDDDVMYVEPPLPTLTDLNDGNRVRTGSDVLNAPPYGLDGSGVTVMVYDGGQVYRHDDLAGRLTIGLSDGGETRDHATHVACTIGGAGDLYPGMAPGVDIVSYSIEQPGGLSQGFLYTDPGDLEDDYSEAISLYGVDLANNSIGTNTAHNGYPCDWEGNYGATGALIDAMVRGSLGSPLRVVWANGNERGSGRCGTTYHTTAPPACAKNHLTVGGLNSDDDSITSFTSWGPCDDGRLKPDVSAPGCEIGGHAGVISCSREGGYAIKCGTSMASPTAAGVASLLLQLYRETYPGRPDFRNSLLRAMLAQTAVDVGSPGPDYRSGFGSIRAPAAAEAIHEERFLEDEVSLNAVYSFTLTVPFADAPELKATLAWDDPPGTPGVDPVLVNDLDLRVVGPSGTVFFPWTLDPQNPGSPAVRTVRDGLNNIEQVWIANPEPGDYTVQIEAVNIAYGRSQPFSLAASHVPYLCSERPSFEGLVNASPGSSCGEIELTWNPAQSNCDPDRSLTYNIYRHTSSPVVLSEETLVYQGVDDLAFTDRGLDPATPYHYIVRASDSDSGEESNRVERSATAPATPDTGAPIFAGLEAANPGAGCGEVRLLWSEAVESCNGPVIYDVHCSTDGHFTPGPATLVATTYGTGLVDTSVTPGLPHYYLVRARDVVGNEETNGVRFGVEPPRFDLEIFHTDFEASGAGWTVVAPDDALEGNWEWGDPVVTPYQPEDDDTADGTRCWITGADIGISFGDVDAGTTTLLSAAYDLTGAQDPEVRYSRWFTNDRGANPGEAEDTFRIDVSNDDGDSWTALEEIGAGTPLAWVRVSLPLPISGTDRMRFRFTAADPYAASIVEAGIDEFSLVSPEQACFRCDSPPLPTLCSISVQKAGDDILLSWTGQPPGTRAAIYHVTGCGMDRRVKLGSTTEDSFVHERAALSLDPFHYRVTFVDECGNEADFCGTDDCP